MVSDLEDSGDIDRQRVNGGSSPRSRNCARPKPGSSDFGLDVEAIGAFAAHLLGFARADRTPQALGQQSRDFMPSRGRTDGDTFSRFLEPCRDRRPIGQVDLTRRCPGSGLAIDSSSVARAIPDVGSRRNGTLILDPDNGGLCFRAA